MSDESNTTEEIDISSTSTITTYDVDFPLTIEQDLEVYKPVIKLLREAKDTDIINIHLANMGGDCHVGFMLCHAVYKSKAFVHMIVENNCHSMGAILALCGDNLTLNTGTFLQFHAYTSSNYGKAGEFTTSVQEFDDYFYNSLTHFCCPFLTKKEINLLRKDTDVYVHETDKDIMERLKRHYR